MRIVPALAAIGLLVATSSAFAKEEDKVRCAAAYEQAQELRRRDNLSASRKELSICEETCPERLAHDCMRWRAEVAALMPTVVLRATDARGVPLRGVRVSLDGELFVSQLEDNVSHAVDPGEHVFRFERAATAPVDVRVTLHGAERDRVLAITLSPNEPASAATLPAAPVAPSRTLAYVLGATGLGALSLAGGLTVAGHVKREDLRSTCAPYCSQASVDGVETMWIAAGISAAVGVVSLGVATYLWISPSSGPLRNRAAVWLAPLNRGVGVVGRFD